jgi:antitoxin component YwqK of YwqJK toxin-antitoxin module
LNQWYNNQLFMKYFKCLKLSFLICVFLLACSVRDKEPEPGELPPGIRVIKEYYPNGMLKTEIQAKGKLRQGTTKDYRKDGTLESLITFENNRKHGLAVSYYPDGKTLKTKMNYVNGYKQGEAIWYYPDGDIYRVTPYVNGRINGIRKTYYNSGVLQSETPYLNGQPGMGLKEYNQDSNLKSYDAKIVIREIDRISMDKTFTLDISLSNRSRSVKFYQGKLTNGAFWNDQLAPIPTEDGMGKLQFHISKGTFKMETLNIVARDKSSLDHYHILQKEYHLAVENKF